MARNRRAKPKAPKKKKPVFGAKRQIMKIMAGLALLVCLIVTAGLLANRFIMRQAPPVVPPAKPIAIKPPDAESVHHSVPEYEAFHREVPPPPTPITRVKPVTNGIPVAIIIDDIGYDREMANGFMALDVPLTFSILPMGPFNHSIIDKALAKDVEIMLHQPMEPGNYPSVNPGPGALMESMTPDELIAQLNANLDRLPNVMGVNNHMGSKLTASSDHMRQVFTVLKQRKLFFVDSRTTAETLCRPSAELLQLPFAERDVFIDHLQTHEFIRKQLKLLVKRAKKQGYAIGIAHPHPVTLDVFRKMMPEIEAAVALTYASKVVAFQQG
jgi:polysaccharide deacetylase 2 family uncharacterized protein YibQ